MIKIDSHTHIIPKNLPKWTEKFGYGNFIHLDHYRSGYARMMQGDKFFREIKSNCWDADLRIKEYAEYQTQVQVVCTIPVLFGYHAQPKHGLEISEYLNDDIAELVTKYPKNYIGLATIPMQDAELAIQELERCKKLGFKGIQIGSNINDKNLSEDEFFPIFKACERLDMAVMVHPWNMMGKGQMDKYWLPWLVAMPAETTRAACSIIFSGVLEKLPKLRVLFSHAGGAFIFTLGRIEHGFNCRPDLVAIDNPVPPSHYLGKFWVDSITHDADALRYIISKVGTNKICLGSDYPFPLGDLEIGKFITEMGLGESEVEDIFQNSIVEWLNLDLSLFK
jgi:aminocarboxymuconate-semialdehyde decarboxylase